MWPLCSWYRTSYFQHSWVYEWTMNTVRSGPGTMARDVCRQFPASVMIYNPAGYDTSIAAHLMPKLEAENLIHSAGIRACSFMTNLNMSSSVSGGEEPCQTSLCANQQDLMSKCCGNFQKGDWVYHTKEMKCVSLLSTCDLAGWNGSQQWLHTTTRLLHSTVMLTEIDAMSENVRVGERCVHGKRQESRTTISIHQTAGGIKKKTRYCFRVAREKGSCLQSFPAPTAGQTMYAEPGRITQESICVR